MSRKIPGLLVFLGMSANAIAASVGTLEYTRVPLSVREAGSGGVYGSYDIFQSFSNPALLAMQPRSFEVGFSGQSMFGGQQNLASLAGGWSGQGVDSGTYGVAALASMFSMPPIRMMDFEGNEGESVSPGGLRVGVVGSYQWEFLGFGAGFESAGENLGVSLNTGEKVSLRSTIIHAGALVRLGRVDAGVAYRKMGSVGGELNTGGAVNFNGFFVGSISGEASIPLSSGDFAPVSLGQYSAGLTWNAHKLLDVRAGVVMASSKGMMYTPGPSLCAGFSAHFREYSLDYALVTSSGGLGMTHALAVGWAFGAERPKPVEFSSLFARKDEGGPKFQIEAKDRTMAVANFEPQNSSAADAAVIADLLRNALVQEGAFNIVEKANMDKVLAEQAFQQTGCTSQECAVKLGKVLNVKYLVVGTFGQTLGQYLLTMRVVDVETARAIYSDEAQGKNLEELRAGMESLAHRMSLAVQKSK